VNASEFDWIHFEGRNIEDTRQMMSWVRQDHPHIKLSVELEKHLEGSAELAPLADLVLFNRVWGEANGYSCATDVLSAFAPKRRPEAQLVCAWGTDGAWAMAADDTVTHCGIFPPAVVVDTLGAGDTFNAGVLTGLCTGRALPVAVEAGCRLAGRKCGLAGYDGLSWSDLGFQED